MKNFAKLALLGTAFCLSLMAVGMVGCQHPTQITTDQPVDTPQTTPPVTTVTSTQPPIISDNIGDLTPDGALSAADAAIVNAVINGSKDLDNRRNRVLLAGSNYPGTSAQLTYCVFDVATRHLLGWNKKFGIAPEDMRLVRDQEYNKANLVKHIDWVFADIQPGDKRVICLSSHGAQDTMADGTTEGVVVSFDMISTGVWDQSTEISLDYWKTKCKSVPAGCNVVLLFDLCYSGADIRAVLSGNPHASKKSRSVDGPPAVQARVSIATARALMRDVNVYNVQFFPMCLDSELSSEGSRTGGAGTWAMWSSIDKNGVDALATVITRDANWFLRTDQDSQHITVLGHNNKMPITKAAPAP